MDEHAGEQRCVGKRDGAGPGGLVVSTRWSDQVRIFHLEDGGGGEGVVQSAFNSSSRVWGVLSVCEGSSIRVSYCTLLSFAISFNRLLQVGKKGASELVSEWRNGAWGCQHSPFPSYAL